MENYNILILDDEKDVREELAESFQLNNYTVFCADLPSTAFKILLKESIDIVILDIKLPEMDGIEVLRKIKAKYPDIEVIMITAHGDKELLLQSMKYGALDFFNKPLRIDDIELAFERTKNFFNLKEKMIELKISNSLLSKNLQMNIGDIIGTSIQMNQVIELSLKASQSSNTSVLITGPSGSGKELISRVIHYASPRKNKIFYTVNCSAIPESLIESEFFGYNKGAFTGATENRIGCFEAANGGTLFLDELADLPLSAQAKLLRVLEDGKIRHVGGRKDIQTDVRIVAATNKNIELLIKEQKFREDLYYRLNTIEIEIPPLSKRIDDIPLLIRYYIDYYSDKMNKGKISIDNNLLELLKDYPFPGNIRELKNIVERALIYCDNNKLTFNHFPCLKDQVKIYNNYTYEKISKHKNISFNLYEVEKNTIIAALEQSNYHQTKASKLLGITTSSLNRKIEKFKINIIKTKNKNENMDFNS